MVDWLQIGQTSGSGDTQILVRAFPYTGDTMRDTTLVLSGVTKHINIIAEQIVREPDYLAFTILSGGTIVWGRENGDYGTGTTIYYNVNSTGWNELSSISGTPISVNAGDVVKFRGDYNSYGPRDNPVTFSGSTASFSLSGNIMSLVDSENFSDITQIPYSETFPFLFASCNVVDANQLLLPATTLKQWCYACMFRDCASLISAPALPATSLTYYCYFNMFNGCTSLTTAPELPAKSLVSYCYFHMFQGCSNLNYIKCLATNISASGSHSMWLDGVASTGTFVKSASMTGWSTGNNGIPSGWTVEDAT